MQPPSTGGTTLWPSVVLDGIRTPSQYDTAEFIVADLSSGILEVTIGLNPSVPPSLLHPAGWLAGWLRCLGWATDRARTV